MKYRVDLILNGTVTYEVEAETEIKAEEIAINSWWDRDDIRYDVDVDYAIAEQIEE